MTSDYGTPARPRIWPWVVAGHVVLLIGPIVWGINVATSGIRGQGDAIATRNSSENWTEAQATFEDLYAEIEATDRKVAIAREAWDGDPDDRTLRDTYFGTRTVCQSMVGDYNAEARKFLSEDFRAVDLPAQIDLTNPLTDCQE